MIELKNAVNEAKIKLGLSNSELSKLIGHSRNYVSETLRIGASTEKQAQLVSKIKEAEVDELQLKLSEDSRVLHNVIDIERRKYEELQKRINEVLDYVGTDFEDYYTGVITESIHEILKGNTNDH